MSTNLVMSIEYSVQDIQTGEKVDSNVGRAPLEFITGMGQIIEGLESALLKMNSGEKADVKVDPEFGYGIYNDEAVQTLPAEQFTGIELVEGMTLYGTSEDGETVQVAVKSFDNENVVIDYNHPLAGKTLMFSVSLLEVRDATAEEIATGYVGGMPSGGCCGGGSCGTGHDHGHSHGGGCGSDHGHSGGGCGCH